MFRSRLILVVSMLHLARCAPGDPVNRNAPGGPRCFSCPSVEEPYLCNVTTQCRHDEQCYTDEYSINDGTNVFSVGCRKISECYTAIVRRSDSRRRDVKQLKCVKCCHGNLCNGGGCSAGLGKSNVCYNCRFIKDPRLCQHETICQGNEHCFIEKVLTQSYDIKYILGCVENTECETLRQFGPLVGKRDMAISTLCASCCYADKCNDVCPPQAGFTSTTLRISSATPSHGLYENASTPTAEDTTVAETTNAGIHTTIPVTKDTHGIDTTYGMSFTSLPITDGTTVVDRTYSESHTSHPVTEDTTVIDTTYGMPHTSHLMTEDTTVVETSGTSYTSHSMSKDTTTVDATNWANSSPLPVSTVTAFSTVENTMTTSVSTSTTTPAPTSTKTSALTNTVCHKECSGSIECRATDVQLCSVPTPYCLTVLDKHASGSYNISKRCADRNTCNDKWLKQTSGDNRCVFFNPAIKDTFTCFFCCTAHKCNIQSFPPYMSSLYVREADGL